MSKQVFRFLILLSALLLSQPTITQASPTDSVRISLLTCSPGTEIYALFGHTAIRYEDPTNDVDITFNYGMFSFNTPNFILRFVKGETDYQLGFTEYPYFEAEYAMRNSSVYQQTLNLLPEEKVRLWEILKENYKEENRTYRYNFFYDNCTSRARDKIEECINGTIQYDENNQQLSFRDIVHEHTAGHAWAEFGIDLCLGSKADAPIDYRLKMFAPSYLMNAAEHAQIISKTHPSRNLLINSKEVVTRSENENDTEKKFIPTPLLTTTTLLICTLLISAFGVWKKKALWGVDLLFFGAAGAAGCVITFLVCFSEHPTVSPNYLLLFLHPLQLLYLPWMIYKERKRRKDPYQLINAIVLTLFILLWGVFPQKFNLAVLPLALCLLTRSVSNLILIYKRK